MILLLFLIVAQLHHVLCLVHNHTKRSPLDTKINSDLPPPHPSEAVYNLPPVFAPLVQPHSFPVLTGSRKKKGPNIPFLPLPHQLLVTKLHVIPAQSNIHHNTIHTVNHNVQIPIITQTLSHGSNVTHSSQLVPILIPIHHNHLVPLHDLSVIPLHRQVHNVEAKYARLKAAIEKKDNDEEINVNRYRTFYGGFGQLLFGGHGAGHGFYSYG